MEKSNFCSSSDIKLGICTFHEIIRNIDFFLYKEGYENFFMWGGLKYILSNFGLKLGTYTFHEILRLYDFV